MTCQLPVLFLLTSISALAQTARGPVLGWQMADNGKAVRPIAGAPGASHVGDPASIPADLRLVSISPAATIAVAILDDTALPVLYDVASGHRMPLEGARSAPAQVAWSPSGTAIALLYGDSALIQVFALSDNTFRLREELASGATRIAVADGGGAVLALAESGLVLWRSGAANPVTTLPVNGFAFLAGGIVPAFQADGQLTIGSAGVPLSAEDGEQFFLVSPDRDRLLVVRSTTGRVLTFAASGELLSQDGCDCAVAGLDTIGRPRTVRLRVAAERSPVWLAEAGEQQRLYFVPALEARPDSEP